MLIEQEGGAHNSELRLTHPARSSCINFSENCTDYATLLIMNQPHPLQLLLQLIRDGKGSANEHTILNTFQGCGPNSLFIDSLHHSPAHQLLRVHLSMGSATDFAALRD